MLVYENPGDSGISDTNFIKCDPDRTFLMTVTSGSSFLIIACSFSGSREHELNRDFFVIDGCQFEVEKFPEIRFLEAAKGRQPGFAGTVAKAGGASWVYETKMLALSRRSRYSDREKQTIWAISAGIAGILASGITWAVVTIRRRWGEMKVPKAFQ
jgi:hypothetical protein